jgi:hypothetical protein
MYQHRKDVEQDILSSHGDATRFFVTFLDSHDVKERIRFVDPADEHRFDAQVSLGLASLFAVLSGLTLPSEDHNCGVLGNGRRSCAPSQCNLGGSILHQVLVKRCHAGIWSVGVCCTSCPRRAAYSTPTNARVPNAIVPTIFRSIDLLLRLNRL